MYIYFPPDIVVDDNYILIPSSSHIIYDTTVFPINLVMNVVQQKMKGSAHEHMSGCRVIIDDILLYSTSLSVCLILLEWHIRVSGFDSTKPFFWSPTEALEQYPLYIYSQIIVRNLLLLWIFYIVHVLVVLMSRRQDHGCKRLKLNADYIPMQRFIVIVVLVR